MKTHYQLLLVPKVPDTDPVLGPERVGSLWRDGPVGHKLRGSLQLLVNIPVGGLVVLLHYGVLVLVIAGGTHLTYHLLLSSHYQIGRLFVYQLID